MNAVAEKLGLQRVLELIAEQAVSDCTREKIRQAETLEGQDAILQQLNRINALQMLKERGELVPIRCFEDIREELQRCRVEGSYLFAENLLNMVIILQQCKELIGFYKKHRENLKPLAGLLESIDPLERESGLIRRITSEDGTIKDSASAELTRIRRQIQQTVTRLHREVDRVMDQARRENWLHEENPTIRDGRFVLPLRSESKRKIKGIIHGQSATGATSYVEPLIIVEINNTLKELEIAEQEEIERILKQVTGELRPQFNQIRINLDILIETDFLNACAGFSRQFHCSIPDITSEQQTLEFQNARHPLLALVKEVVPLNVSIPGGIHCVIITGPNAGGKTVAMKTIGLLSLMIRYGFPVPVEDGSRIPCFDKILMDIGDQQSIENNLSTFTSHVSNLKTILESATSRSLVLIDELGTGTDPLEGAALGRAVLESLVQRGTLTVVTTHHSGLKAYADQDPHVLNAAMEFDTDELQPTYRFRLGLPGSSYALEISKRIGLADTVVTRARDLMGAEQVKLEHLLLEIETLKSRIEKENRSVERNKQTLDKLIDEYEEKLAAVRAKHEAMDEKIAEELERLVNESRSKIEHAVKDIREKGASRETIIDAQKTLQSIRTAAQKRQPCKIPPKVAPEKCLSVGDAVRVAGTSGIGQIIELHVDKRRAAVDITGKTIWVSLDSLEPVQNFKEDYPAGKSVLIQAESLPSTRLDLRGKRFEEAREELERYLDRALLAGMKQVQIIHGKGSGALQKMTREVLKNTPGVRKFYFENFDQGGTGVTIVEM
ncbi:MAG TPA: endonuclease MutS2 [Candidatus Marinimicrobia bacterium]|nr:endonuclease MutS2 [Candidatus Neomarinimicrobiota bacterium]